MNIVVIYELTKGVDKRRNGGSIRREGLMTGLREAGHVVHEVPLRFNPRRNFLVRHWKTAILDYVPLELLNDKATRYHVEGLPLWPLLARLPAPACWDLCDSWLLKYWSEWNAGRSFASLGRAAAAALALLASNRSRGHTCIYISDRDADFDRYLRRGVKVVTIANGTDIEVASRNGDEVRMAADWSYAPNLTGARWIMEAVGKADAPSTVYVYGPSVDGVPDSPIFRKVGYADSVQEIYDGAKLIMAPILDGAGVKNKVVEALCAGLPTVTTTEGIAGLPWRPAWCHVADGRDEFVSTWAALTAGEKQQIPKSELAAFREHFQWSNAVRKFVDVHEQSVRPGRW